MSNAGRGWTGADYVLTAAVMGLMGAFYWAIRGTSGYGGEIGGTLAGFGWALLWYAFSRVGEGAERRPYGTPWILLAITLGIAIGGMTGYGVYISWLNGRFHLSYPDGLRSVPAWTGYAMLLVCGLHWGGNTGCLMAWCAPTRPLRGRDWVVRIACGVCGAVAAAVFVRVFPQLLLPYYAEGIYSIPEYKTCVRALDSIRTIAPHVGLFLGFLVYEIARGDRRAAAMILTVALGFAIPFTVGGYWQTMHESPLRLDWWKNWEMTIGLGGGLSLGLAFWLFNRPADAPRSHLDPMSRALFRSGIPLWLPSIVMLKGAYDGWCEIRSLQPSISGNAVLLIISVLPLLGAWAWRRRSEVSATDVATFHLSIPAIAAFQALIIGLGYLVSIPIEWRLANIFLVTIYACYIVISLILAGILFHRQRTTQ